MLSLLLDSSGSLPEGYQKIGIGEAAVDALLGFIVVFLGIAFLVGIVWLVGFVMHKATGKTVPKGKKAEKPEALVSASSETADDDLPDEETVAVITAAIMAYYVKEKPKCEFTVKRIKRL